MVLCDPVFVPSRCKLRRHDGHGTTTYFVDIVFFDSVGGNVLRKQPNPLCALIVFLYNNLLHVVREAHLLGREQHECGQHGFVYTLCV